MDILLVAIVLVAIVSAFNVMCFIVGAKVGQKVAKDEPIELQIPNPMKVIRELQDKREADREQQRVNTILENIDNYDGTGNGQKDV
jgi:hypothetical protein